MPQTKAYSISLYSGLMLFLNFVNGFSQIQLGDSIVHFYNSHPFSFHFVNTYYSSSGSIEIVKGRMSGYRDGEIYYRLNLDTMFYRDKRDFMGMDCAKNKTTIGCNYATDSTYTDLSQNARQYDQTVGFYLPSFIDDHDTIKELFNDKSYIVNTTTDKNFYYTTIIDTHIVDTGFEKSIRKIFKYKISKKNYTVISLRSQFDSSVDNVKMCDSSETVYFYDEKTRDQVYKYVNSFKPLAKEDFARNYTQQQDTVSSFPDFTLIDSLKRPFSSKTINARYTIVEFWYRGCLPCMANIKKLNTIRTSFDKKFLEIVAVNGLDSLNKDLKNFIIKFKPTYTLLFDGQVLNKTLGLVVYPTTYIYDNKTHKVLYYKKGTGEHYTEDIISVLNKLK